RHQRGAGYATRADAELARADSLYGANDFAGAAAAYGAAVAAEPAKWAQHGRAGGARLYSLSQADSAELCVNLALAELPRERHTTFAANVAGSGLGCALELPADHPQRAEKVRALEAAAREIVVDTTITLSGDDRSGL